MYVSRCLFFFQAEDGIRDLVRSRGLGDVYKRQVHRPGARAVRCRGWRKARRAAAAAVRAPARAPAPVSYTHLTLPTSDLV